MASKWALTSALVLLSGCGEVSPPPGRRVDLEEPGLRLPAPTKVAATAAIGPGASERQHQLASIAMRSWVYLEPDDQSSKLGYLRAGAIVARQPEPLSVAGCDGGWYGIEPRGHVCVGKGATLDLTHPVVRATGRGPKAGEPMPYRYVISKSPPPHLYFKLPSEKEQQYAEGKRRKRSMALFSEREIERLGPPAQVPPALSAGKQIPKPYGAERALHYASHRGRANEASAFGLLTHFEYTGRHFGLTSELDVIPLDRTRPVRLSEVEGMVVQDGGTPAFVIQHAVSTYRRADDGRLRSQGRAAYRSGWTLLDPSKSEAGGLVETSAGVWLPRASLRIAELRVDPAGYARDGRKWIDISIRQQLLVAYEGERPVYAALISSGRGGMRDPEETHATVRGTFMIHAKHLTATMDGDEDTSDSFDLRDVPYVQYFHKGYAIHGAYWHNDFGKERSHGCVNLTPTDAAWIFGWSEPAVPAGWHGALNSEAGTLVYIHG